MLAEDEPVAKPPELAVAELLPAAARNVLAHLVALHELGAVRPDDARLPEATWHPG